MTILVLTDKKSLFEKIAALVAQIAGKEAIVLQEREALEASLLMIEYNPIAIVIDLESKNFDSFKFISTFPPNTKRHYALAPKRKSLAIKAIRHGVNGMFDFENDEDDFLSWLLEKRKLIESNI